ncbi:hypothetical protein SAMN05216358_0520 [Rhizobium sp. AN5]|nr:hypothetical protein SAMN05216358_0520 [Rhizobium sp. AN5]
MEDLSKAAANFREAIAHASREKLPVTPRERASQASRVLKCLRDSNNIGSRPWCSYRDNDRTLFHDVLCPPSF